MRVLDTFVFSGYDGNTITNLIPPLGEKKDRVVPKVFAYLRIGIIYSSSSPLICLNYTIVVRWGWGELRYALGRKLRHQLVLTNCLANELTGTKNPMQIHEIITVWYSIITEANSIHPFMKKKTKQKTNTK